MTQPKNPWLFSVEVGYAKAKHRPAGELTGVEVRVDPDTAFEVENLREGETLKRIVPGDISLDHYFAANEHSYPGFVNEEGEQLSNADKIRFQGAIDGWCTANCKGKFRLLVPDVYADAMFIQFHLEPDMRAYLAEFGGEIRQPTRSERSVLMSMQEMAEMGMRAMKGDPEAIAWLRKPVTIGGKLGPSKPKPQARPPRWRH